MCFPCMLNSLIVIIEERLNCLDGAHTTISAWSLKKLGSQCVVLTRSSVATRT